MKILFDPIYSSQPDVCSSAAKFKKITERLLASREDVFIYWPIPEWINARAVEWLPDSDRVEYIPFPCMKDRVREYLTIRQELDHLVAFNGHRWDYDVLITMRTQQVPSLRAVMGSPRLKHMTWMKKVILLEEMAVYSWRKTVPTSDNYAQDLLTSAGYLCADRSFITAQHVREGAIRSARGYYTPSQVKRLSERLTLVNPAIVSEYEEKPPKYKFKRGQEPFCLGFVGRMSNTMSRLETIYKVMDNNWIMKGDKGFKVILSTVTTAIKMPPPEFCTVENNTREEFWARVKEDMHLVLSMEIDAEFAMGLIELMLFGTPVILAREPWSEALFGKEYPYYCKGEKEAYGLVRAFHDDYDMHYSKFLDWREAVFKPRFEEGGPYELNLYDEIEQELKDWEDYCFAQYREKFPAKADNDIVQAILKKAEGRDDFVMFDVLHEVDKAGELQHLGSKLADDARNARGLTFSTAWNEFRLALQIFHGYEDASTIVGHLRKSKA